MTDLTDFAFGHLDRMSDERGLFEHAEGAIRREEHGYCTDDNARLLLVSARELDNQVAHRLGRLALKFVLEAQAPDGSCRNRMDRVGRWTDEASTNDCWGRSLMGLGVAAAQHPDPSIRSQALAAFNRGGTARSTWPRAMAFAAVGAVEVVAADPGHRAGRALLADTLDVIRQVGPLETDASTDWRWPEARLSYANATLAEAVIGAGAALERSVDIERGLAMLEWLLELETTRGHLSVVAVGGRGPGDSSPRFDQQPIEASAMADACSRAFAVTGDATWSRGVTVATRWFTGNNDSGLQMYNSLSGGGFDGLHADAVNRNQGAESTLAFISTMQRSRELALSR
jgi:hypothetical protein